MDLKIETDPERRMLLRLDEKDPADIEIVGIYVRAQDAEGKWHNTDIAALDASSLLRWLRRNGGDNKLAENVVGIILGHGHLHGR